MSQHAPRPRPRCFLVVAARSSVRFVSALAVAAALACGGDDEARETADSAVAYGAAPFDSGRVDSSSGTLDTATTDSLEGGEDAAGSGAVLVLIADSVSGRKIYNGTGTCFTCHALDGAGVANLGSSLRDSSWMHIDGSFASISRVIRDGIPVSASTRRGMPAFGSRLSDAELYRIAAYTYTLSHPGSAVADTAVADSAAATSTDTSTAPR